MKFSVRDLFLVTVIVVPALGWWVGHNKRVADAIHLQEGWNATKKELTIPKRLVVIYRTPAADAIGSLMYIGDGRGQYRVKTVRSPNSSACAPTPPKN
jgi:hypothetical protein